MAMNLQANLVIESATLELTAKDLEVLAAAAPHLQTVCEAYANVGGDMTARPAEVAALDPVARLLANAADLVDKTGTVAAKMRRQPRNKARS